jgi:phage gp29-like protein
MRKQKQYRQPQPAAKKAAVNLQTVFSRVATDPQTWSYLRELPNPDPILRKAGKNSDIYHAISRDAHVIGELRTMRAGLLAFQTELVPGGSDKASMDSFEAAKKLFNRPPSTNTRWQDFDWHLYSAILFGFSSVHLGPFIKTDDRWLPQSIEAWETRRFVFDPEHNLLLKTKESPQGIELDPRRFFCVRHMPSPDNAYGVALLSSCFWPWTFKHGGFQFFVQLCERFGVPFPIGKYPVGSDQKDIDQLLEGLSMLVTHGIGALPDDASVEILERKGGGEPVQAQLIDLCNREMSKALTSQTLATEQNGQGARAASDTHARRASENQRADRALVVDGRNQILQILHGVNFNGGEPPKWIFKDRREVNSETVSRVRETGRLVPVSKEWAYNELGVPVPKEGEELLEVVDDGKGIATPAKVDFSAKDDEFTGFDSAIDKQVAAIFQFAKNAKDLQELRTHIEQAMPGITASGIAEITRQALTLEYLSGMSEADDGQELELELSKRS